MPAAPALSALLALAALTCARAEISPIPAPAARTSLYRRSIHSTGTTEVRSCMYGGRWFAEGGAVAVRDACLRCVCARGALSCARAACAPAPAPPPRRCALLHRRGACCPELHCPDGVKSLELEASARLEENTWDVATPAAPAHACVEEGGVFAAGSALSAGAACEQCFCLRGARRCVRPRCLPPPRACRPRPAPGACCPDRYYCDSAARNLTTAAPPASSPSALHGQHDCEVNGEWVSEGERVAFTTQDECSACFCLRGRVRCQPLACAPPLHGCTPLLRPGHCCPHQYHCPHAHHGSMASIIPAILDNALVSTRYDERSFHTSASTEPVTTTKTAPTSVLTTQTAPAAPAPTTKVKRKTNDPPPTTVTHYPSQNATKTTSPTTTVITVTTEPTTTTESKPTSTTEVSTTAQSLEQTSTEQPEGSVKIIINGTINCTAELSSTPMLTTLVNDTDKIQLEANPRFPYGSSGGGIEAQTVSPADIITDRDVSGGFDDDDSFTVNVTSSLRANMSRPLAAAPPPPSAPPAPPAPSTPPNLTQTLNISKKTKEDYDYDYTEPTLPPSLPNLKIIPFVAADAVVDEDVSSKEDSLTYPALEREDKFPVYYPAAGAGAGAEREGAPFATRREVVLPTQYPVFVSAGVVSTFPAPPAPAPPPDVATTKPATKPPTTTSTRHLTIPTPAVNLFSPPVETEGGFVPKGPGIIGEYYAVYPSTPPPAPHLTTSMQINPTNTKSECVTSEGRRVPAGGSVWRGCSVCACAWGELSCAPRRCAAPPPGCHRRAATATHHDLCCGDIVCDHDNATTSAPLLSTRRTEITLNVTKIPIEIESELIPFDPPPDRSVPATSDPAVDEQNAHNLKDPDVIKLDDITPSVPTTEYNVAATILDREAVKRVTTSKATTTTSTVKSSTTSTATTPAPIPDRKEVIDTGGQSQEYEDEEDDEGFSFGSVLKLLLSDNYETTPASVNKKKPPTKSVRPPAPTSTTTPTPASPPPTSIQPPATPMSVPFIPIQPHPYIPNKLLPQNTVNRIDHLVLGEATAIKRTSPRPATAAYRPASTPHRRPPARPTTRRPATSTRAPTTRTESPEYAPAAAAQHQPATPAGGGGGGGLLKLAGCNIYGRMYRVGRIIAELSTPCQECRCTELGVQCTPLHC